MALPAENNRSTLKLRLFTLALVLSLACATLLLGQVVQQPRPGEVANFRFVTEAMLRNPPPEDWLNWRRTDDNWGYSPLNGINTRNMIVGRVRTAGQS